MMLLSNYVSFPKLGWELPISDTLVSFEVFGLEINIRWYAVMIACGVLLAVLYAMRRYKQFGLDGDRMFDVVLVGFIFAFIGARLFFVLFSENRDAYFKDPLSILRVWEGGLAIYGGVIAAFLTGLWMCKLRKVNTLAMFDLASLGFLIGQGVGRWGNFFNQEAFGANTDLPWGMSGSVIQLGVNGSGYDPALPVHPTFLYESLWCLVGFAVLHFVSKRWKKFDGQIFALYIIWYGSGRFVIEGLRTDSLYLGTMRVSQLIAVVAVLAGLVLLLVLRARKNVTRRDLFAAEGATTLDLDATDVSLREETTETVADEAAVEETVETAEEIAEEQREAQTQEVTDGDQN